MNNCPNCGAKISLWNFNGLLSTAEVKYINKNYVEVGNEKDIYCDSCAELTRQKPQAEQQKIQAEQQKIQAEQQKIQAEQQKIQAEQQQKKAQIWASIKLQVPYFPILTCPIPTTYHYEIKNSVISKMHEGKNLDTLILDCKLDIMIQCINLGGNAVFSTTLNFLEVGSSVFYYQVIMMGTAVLIKDTSLQELSEESVKCISKIETLLTTLDNLEYTVSKEDKSVGNNRRMSRRREEIERQQRAAAANGGGGGE